MQNNVAFLEGAVPSMYPKCVLLCPSYLSVFPILYITEGAILTKLRKGLLIDITVVCCKGQGWCLTSNIRGGGEDGREGSGESGEMATCQSWISNVPVTLSVRLRGAKLLIRSHHTQKHTHNYSHHPLRYAHAHRVDLSVFLLVCVYLCTCV